MRKILVISLWLLTSAGFVNAQSYENRPFDIGIVRDFTWGEYDHSFFDMVRYPKDPSAEAVVMKEFGKTWLTSNGNTTTLMAEYHVKIKLFTDRALKRGHIEIPYYIQDNGAYEEINPTSVQGITYYATPDGGMHSISLSQDSIAIVKKSKHWSAIVFNMPKLSKGCIIEYKYRFESPFFDSFRKWEFQLDIPKVYSEYETHIPSVFKYNISLRGPLKFSRDTVNIEKQCFVSSNVNSDCSVEDYRIDNIPAFKAEPLMQSPKNYMSALYFQVSKSTKLNNFVTLNASYERDVAVDWTNADYSLRYDERFGSQINHASVIKDKITPIVSSLSDTLEKAKAVYAFIQKKITFDGQNSIYTDNGIKKALDKHNGNAVDVNLALTAALNDAGIKAYAVIISTRDNGLVSNNYPAITEFNSVISFAIINNKGYLMDATDPSIPFGMLPFKDLNDHGRVFPLDKPSYWKKLVTPQQRLGTATADLAFNGSILSGTITSYSKGYTAYERRASLTTNKVSGDKQVIPGLVITKFDNNAADQNQALTATYQVQVNNQGNAGSFTFVPFMLGKPIKQPFELLDTLTANPFVSETREYVVDFGMPASYSFSITVHLPAGYKIDNPPQSVEDTQPGIGSVNATFNADRDTATYIFTYSLDKATYTPDDYAKLKALFNKIILAEKAPFTIKKQ